MSDFVPRDILPDLWKEILQRHWTYLESEESMAKIEERNKLEGCLKDFLCIVPHDRKFFLAETAHVLRKSITEMDDFSAYKASIGFDSISQYANNLFTKPWRKEYRVIKLFSGFYQHEIKSNLLDAEKLFEAMGYKLMPNQTLVLDGPICPDQVTNVSRDAMAAYVECQIMKQIYSGLTAMQLSCNWVDILSFREVHIGGASQAINAMAYTIQERRLRKEKLASENCYMPVLCNSCNLHQCSHQPPLPQQSSHHQQQQQAAPIYCSAPHPQYNQCTVHPNQPLQNLYAHSNHQPPMPAYQDFVPPPSLPHSKSLEHYVDHSRMINLANHRHSFDQPFDHNRQQLYETPNMIGGGYDCIDGLPPNLNYNTYTTHPYNVSGNRYPLPYNISNQFNTVGVPMPPPPSVTCGDQYGVRPPPPPPPLINNCYHPDRSYHEYNVYNKSRHNSSSAGGNERDFNRMPSCDNCNVYQQQNNRNVRMEQLIDLDYKDNHGMIVDKGKNGHYDRNGGGGVIDIYDKPILKHTTYGEQGKPQNGSTHDHHNGDYLLRQNAIHDASYDVNGYNFNTVAKSRNKDNFYDTPKSHSNHLPSDKEVYNRNVGTIDDVDDNYLYGNGRNNPNNDTRKPKKIDKYVRNTEILGQYEKYINNDDKATAHLKQPRTSDFDSYDDDCTGDHNLRHKPMANKNQDGVGSFESWDYVFQNLEKQGYNKDLGERGDLLVQGLDLDSLTMSGNDKRRSRNAAENNTNNSQNPNKSIKIQQPQNNENLRTKNITNERTDNTIRSEVKPNSRTAKIDTEFIQKSDNKLSQVQKLKSTQPVQKSTKASTIATSSSAAAAPAPATTITTTTVNNNNEIYRTITNKVTMDRNEKATKQSSTSILSVAANHNTINNKLHNRQNTADNVQQSSGRKSSLSQKYIEREKQTSSLNSKANKSEIAVIGAPNEWSCRFCTYLNPDSKRICDMCSKSKDFILDSGNTPTCV